MGWSFLRSRRWLGYYAMLTVFSIGCVLLGNWQFARRAEAQAEIARIDNHYGASPVRLEQALPEPQDYDQDAHKWLPVEMVGTYLHDEQLLARNRANTSQVGYEILSPLRLRNGEVFLVNRGWIPRGDEAGAPVDIPKPPTGETTVIARLKAGEPTINGRAPDANTVGTIHLPEISELIAEPMYTGAYGLLVSETPSAEHGVLPEKPERDEGPHLSYALQWYVFIIIAILGVIYAARQEYISLNRADVATKKGEASRARKPSDASEEDALLDAQER